MAAKKGGLGRGLDALFENVSIEEPEKKSKSKAKAKEEPSEGGVLYVDINEIKPNANQPRKNFDEGKLQELADSIKQHGIIQPIVLRKAAKGYEIVAGERRYRASRKAGLKKVPCVVRELTDEQNMLIAIIENMQREDLNPIEEAEGLNQMIQTYGLTQDQVSKSVGKSRPYISNAIRLLKLPEAIQTMTKDGALSAGHSRAIAGIEDKELQVKVAEKAVADGMSVRELEKYISGLGKETEKKPVKPKNADLVKVEEELKEALGTKVSISKSPRKGKIQIEYYSREELERLIELLKNV